MKVWSYSLTEVVWKYNHKTKKVWILRKQKVGSLNSCNYIIIELRNFRLFLKYLFETPSKWDVFVHLCHRKISKDSVAFCLFLFLCAFPKLLAFSFLWLPGSSYCIPFVWPSYTSFQQSAIFCDFNRSAEVHYSVGYAASCQVMSLRSNFPVRPELRAAQSWKKIKLTWHPACGGLERRATRLFH